MTIYDKLKGIRSFNRYDGEFGIEIETETKNPYDHPSLTYWKTTTDGSLRNFGVEYVLRAPLKFDKEIPEALNEFKDKTKHLKFIQDSISTSVHTHVNMLNETFLTMGNFMTLYSFFENIFIKYSGPDRLSNLFCLPICDAESNYHSMVSIFKHIQERNYKGISIPPGSSKYAALNLSSLWTYGSLEIRSFRGETDIDKIYKWISIINSVLTFSRDKSLCPKDIIEIWRNSKEDILDIVFGNNTEELFSVVPKKDVPSLLEKNLFYAASIAFSVKDWFALDEEPKLDTKRFPLRVLKEYANTLYNKPWEELSPQEQMIVYKTVEIYEYPKAKQRGKPWSSQYVSQNAGGVSLQDFVGLTSINVQTTENSEDF